ncbi:CPBP family intramembrane glutamic endopeptidase [Oceanivirga salmonicida]|uniref:CPBP family intramembrane glutamic endopeptidase n=1 Tax=Oceanivirga salmonicida TaxID=1769291 RepID=UPI0008342C6E|nr:CPBP family intramembrane glutamic endopeptidase [Oceanivirga salmonicida]
MFFEMKGIFSKYKEEIRNFNNIVLYYLICLVLIYLYRKGISKIYTAFINYFKIFETDLVSLYSTVIDLVVVIIVVRFFLKHSFSAMGYGKENIVRKYFKGVLFGFMLFFICFSALYLMGYVNIGFSTNFNMVLLILYVFGYMIQGMAEEVALRGFFFSEISNIFGILPGMLLSSFAFSALHLGNSGMTVLAFINLVLFGIFAALIYYLTENLWFVGGLHSMWNFTQGNIFGFEVSGYVSDTSILSSSIPENNTIITGGIFGIEGSIILTFIYIVLIIISVRMILKKCEKYKFILN